MPSQTVVIAPFEAVYIGNYGGIVPLTRLNAMRTEGARIQETLPTEYTSTTDIDEIVGNHAATITLSFLAVDDIIVRLARGLSITASTTANPNMQQYSLFVVHPAYDTKNSYWFPQIRTLKTMELSYTKSNATALQVQFTTEFRDPAKAIIEKNTVAALLTSIGVLRAPFIIT
jgi:hypothetical protein